MVKIIEPGRNDLAPQTSNQRRSRNLSNEFKSDLEKQEHAILLYRSTHSISEVSKFTGLSLSFLFNWLKKIGEYKETGCDYLSSKEKR
jgi:transposase-like protein